MTDADTVSGDCVELTTEDACTGALALLLVVIAGGLENRAESHKRDPS